MPNRAVYPRSSARPIYITASVLGLLGLAGVIVMLVAMADVPRQSYVLLIAAFGLLTVALSGALAVLLATNTRRPWGIDPNLGPHITVQGKEEADPFASPTRDLMRQAVQLPDGKGYGRRQSDDETVVQRLAAVDRPLPLSLERPAWASEMLSTAFGEESPARAPEESTEPITEIPLDQLELTPPKPTSANLNERHVDSEA